MEKVYLTWLRKFISGFPAAHLINSSALPDKLFHPWHQPIILYLFNNKCLTIIFQKCSSNPESSIMTRVAKYRKKFCECYIEETNSSQINVAEQRFKQAGCLYYRVMKMLLDMVSVQYSHYRISLAHQGALIS